MTTKPPGSVMGILVAAGGSAGQMSDEAATTSRTAAPLIASRMQSLGIATPRSGADSRSGTPYPVYLFCWRTPLQHANPDAWNDRVEPVVGVIRFGELIT